jgi:hypothetical protein
LTGAVSAMSMGGGHGRRAAAALRSCRGTRHFDSLAPRTSRAFPFNSVIRSGQAWGRRQSASPG